MRLFRKGTSRKNRGEGFWNGGPHSPISGTESKKTGIVRKLGSIVGELEPLAKQGKVEGFFNNVKNADKLGGLVEDIRDAVMDYQVRNQNDLASPMLDIYFRLRYNKISMITAANSL